jgi:hypothetical protein
MSEDVETGERAMRATRGSAGAGGWAVLLALLLAVLAGRPGSAHADTDVRKNRLYLAEVAMVLEGSRRLLLWTENHVNEPEFARFAHPAAERYVEMAGRLVPPEHLVAAHPHLLLVVENVERALDAAASGDTSAFRQRARTVREFALQFVGRQIVINELTLDAHDPFSKQPDYKKCAVRIRRAARP